MKLARIAMVLLAFAALAVPAAWAQTPPAEPAPPAKARRLTPTEQVEQHIARLHSALKITAAQTGPWDAFAKALRDNAAHMEGLYQLRAQHGANSNAVDSMKSAEEIAEAHAQDLQKLEPVFEALYASMDAKQKKTADRLFHSNAVR
jgi:hypothetical protein